MKKIYFLVLEVFIIFVLFFWWLNGFWGSPVMPMSDEKNTSYIIDGQKIALVNGKNEKELVVRSASKLVTSYFGNEVLKDFNEDGFLDKAFLLTQTSGGSGTFYYVALALGSKEGLVGANSIYLGDRIAPQSTYFQNQEITVNYADRHVDEPMTVTPSVGVSRYFKVVEGSLIEVEK